MDDPSPSSKYCQICREYFKNYDQHLELKGHVLRWHHNEFNQDIQHLCQKVNAIDTPANPSNKSKPIQKK